MADGALLLQVTDAFARHRYELVCGDCTVYPRCLKHGLVTRRKRARDGLVGDEIDLRDAREQRFQHAIDFVLVLELPENPRRFDEAPLVLDREHRDAVVRVRAAPRYARRAGRAGMDVETLERQIG